MFGVAFRLTKSILMLWPLFQPMGQLVTVVRGRLVVPLAPAIGFAEALIAVLVLIWLADRYYSKRARQEGGD